MPMERMEGLRGSVVSLPSSEVLWTRDEGAGVLAGRCWVDAASFSFFLSLPPPPLLDCGELRKLSFSSEWCVGVGGVTVGER